MSVKEYGQIVQPAQQPGTFKEFGEVIQPLSRGKSLLHAPAAGAVERAGDIAGLFQKITPFLPKGPLTPESAQKYSQEHFPHFEKGPEKLLKRTGGLALETALMAPSTLLRTGMSLPLIGAGLAEAGEELGAPEWAQSLLEGLPFFYRGGKKIPIKKGEKQFVDFLRKKGLTENEITPLLKSPEQVNRWSTYAHKGKKSRELMESIYSKTGNIYDTIIQEGKNLSPLSEAGRIKILNDFSKIADEIPHKYRQLIERDMKDFVSKGRAGAEDLINLDKDINAVLGMEGKGGHEAIGRFKGPIKEALNSISPELAQDYSLAKELYKTRFKVKGALINPKDFDRFMDMGEMYGLGVGLANRDMGMMAKVIGTAGARQIAREMLINPRLQNISGRIGEALKKNKLFLAEKYIREFSDIFDSSEESSLDQPSP